MGCIERDLALESAFAMNIRGVVALLAAGLSLAGCGRGQLLSNGGFERGLDAWTHADGPQGSAVPRSDASHTGKLGLRLKDATETEPVTIRAEAIEALPGDLFRIRFYGRIVDGYGVNLFARFLALDGGEVRPPDSAALRREVPEGASDWQIYELEALAPEDTARIEIYIRCNNRAVVTADFDDIEVFRIN